MDTQTIAIISGIAIPIIGGMLALWFKINQRRDDDTHDRIDTLARSNEDEHRRLHGKIDKVSDKVTEIWKHLVRDRK